MTSAAILAWRESVGVFLETSLLTSDDADGFNGRVESYMLDDLVLSRPSAKRQKFDRREATIARDSLDAYMIQLVVSGGIEMRRRGRRIEHQAGQVVAFDCGEVLDSTNTDFDVIAIMAPRARLAPRLLYPDAVHGEALATSGLGRLVAGYVANIFETAARLSSREATVAAECLLDLLAAGFNGAAEAREHTADVAQRALQLRARLYVRDHLASPDLTPESIAQALGLSRSALYALFEPVGGVAAHIRELRLRRSLADLRAIRTGHLSVAEIGYRWGFSSPVSFSRAFRGRFGCAPSEVRFDLNPAVRQSRSALDPVVGDRLYEDWIAGLG